MSPLSTAENPARRMRLRRVPWLVLALATVVGCGSTVQYSRTTTTSTGPDPTTTQLALPPVQTPQEVGVTTAPDASSSQVSGRSIDRGTGPFVSFRSESSPRPIRVGLLTVDLGATYAAAGFDKGPRFDWETNYEALLAGLNKRGGLHGRPIRWFPHTVDGMAPSYDEKAQEVCTQLTQDEHVDIVLSYKVEFDTLSTCLGRAGVTQIDANPAVREDRADLHLLPGLLSPEALTPDRYAPALITRAVASGWLTPKDRLGVVVEGCEPDRLTYRRVVEPLAHRLGIPVESFETTCIVGSTDVGHAVSELQWAALRFRSDGVTDVMYLSYAESGLNVVFAQNADNQRWHPAHYLLTSIARTVPNATSENLAPSQVPYVRGLGWVPGWDVNATRLPAPQIVQDETCHALALAGGLQLPPPWGSEANMNPYLECDALLTADRLLGLTNGRTSLHDLANAAALLGSDYVSPITLGGAVSFRRDGHTGAAEAALFSYKASCQCFSYDTAPQLVP